MDYLLQNNRKMKVTDNRETATPEQIEINTCTNSGTTPPIDRNSAISSADIFTQKKMS